jgi:hypothetical protein
MQCRAGDRVVHLKRPEWGPGEVLAQTGANTFRVYFAYAGEKTLKADFLEVAVGDSAAHPLLDHRAKRAYRKGVTRKTIPEAIAGFLREFPQGFSDPLYFEMERNYKVAAHKLMVDLLIPDRLAGAITANEFERATADAMRVVNATNLIFPQEKMALRDGLRSAAVQERFARTLYRLLYATGDDEARFEGWAELLGDIGAAKWTNASYFQFLAHPDRYIFCKPTVTQQAAEICNFEINYRPELNWLTYRSIQRFAEVLRDEITSLQPRDMIDVQSFIWCIAPRENA